MGLADNAMPGPSNTVRAIPFDGKKYEWKAEGIPVMPYDDRGVKNYYPLMRVAARTTAGAVLAYNDIVLPASDEMDCKACHASGAASADYAGYLAAGLYPTAQAGTPVLCARCHPSNALPGTTVVQRGRLTTVLHRSHANVIDPTNGLPLDSINNRPACYRCHPGSETKCLRGTMGNATAPDGTALMQCQSCHGLMSPVGSPTRQGWVDEPGCEQCHTGTALPNSGQIRFTDAFVSTGLYRTAANRTFATKLSRRGRRSAVTTATTGRAGAEPPLRTG